MAAIQDTTITDGQWSVIHDVLSRTWQALNKGQPMPPEYPQAVYNSLDDNIKIIYFDLLKLYDIIARIEYPHFRGFFTTLRQLQNAEIDGLTDGDFAYVAEIVPPAATANIWIYDGETGEWADSGQRSDLRIPGLAGPAGPTAPTAGPYDNSTRIATTEYVDRKIKPRSNDPGASAALATGDMVLVYGEGGGGGGASGEGGYEIPAGGIPQSLLSGEVRGLLAKADTALQDGDVPAWAMQPEKPAYTAAETGAAAPGDVAAEEQRALAAEALLQGNIDGEARARADADESLSGGIANGISTAQAYTDNKLTNYLTETEVYDAITETLAASGGGAPDPEIDLSRYETKTGADEKMNAAVSTAKAYTDTQASAKVDKVSGMGLSRNDFTNELKTRLETEALVKADIVNSLDSPSAAAPLSAAQGKALNDSKAEKGHTHDGFALKTDLAARPEVQVSDTDIGAGSALETGTVLLIYGEEE